MRPSSRYSFESLNISPHNKQNPPKKEGHISKFFLKFSGHRICGQGYDLAMVGGVLGKIIAGGFK